jgi:hypothetical protein
MQFTMGIIIEEKIKKTWQQLASEKLGYDVDQCPCCKTGRMIRLESFAAHGLPKHALMIRTKPLTHKVS